ncbi:DUF3597 domain-containing protein [Aquabacterium sp. J223]|uniref:DUF3597 domain-containing protein n=1 Tax=Aquabacterium sp. J223 TaxID=2898431 RepID=UPI0021AD55E2|nr:DUF3597 domain-containing protein [Aquabacterium sp. J223]UUX97129.1 DUF3597 domain-containing protein [Aquabacterium sp. J223]
MSIFGSILSKILPGRRQEAAAGTPAATAGATPAGGSGGTTAPAPTAAPVTPSPAAAPVDVEALLNDMAARNGQKLNWRTSIVDLMKLLDLDSSLAARKSLAQELQYSGDMNDSASMNIWLHKQVMRKLAENGGKVPADLRD